MSPRGSASRALSALALLGAVAGFCTGCRNGPTGPPTFPATGTVTFKGGQPVTGGAVQFIPVNDSSFTVSGDIQPDGSFSLSTVRGNERTGGAPEGEYRVTVLLPLPPDQKGVPAVTLPKTYRVGAKDNTYRFEISHSGKP